MLTVNTNIVAPIEFVEPETVREKVPYYTLYNPIKLKLKLTLPSFFETGRAFLQFRYKQPRNIPGRHAWTLCDPSTEIRADFKNPFPVVKSQEFIVELRTMAIAGDFEIQAVAVNDSTGNSWTNEPVEVRVRRTLPKRPEIKTKRAKKRRSKPTESAEA